MSSKHPKAAPKPKSHKPVGSVQARRSAGLVLAVLAGERTPAEAAEALKTSPGAYYLLESRALDGLVQGCEPRPRGKVRTAESELAALEKRCTRLERECSRYQALARAAQRSAGVPAPKKKAGPAKGKRKRKPSVRALKMARRLQPEGAPPADEKPPAPAS